MIDCMEEWTMESGYSKERMELYCDDCFNVLPSVPDGSVNLVLCDLPYGVLNRNNKNVGWDVALPMDLLWREYRRILAVNGTVVLFGQGMFTAKLMLSAEDLWRYNLIWDKGTTTGFLNANRQPLRRHEDILVFQRSKAVYNPQMVRLMHPDYVTHHKEKNSCYGDVSMMSEKGYVRYEKYPDSIIMVSKEATVRIEHPTQKPLTLIRYLVLTYSNEGDVVMDNCMGSGTTGVACVMEKRRFIGMEKDERYFDIARSRIRLAESEPSLF